MKDQIQQVSLNLQNQVTALQGDLDNMENSSPGKKKKAKKIAKKDEILDDTVSGSRSRSKTRKKKNGDGEIVEVDDEGDSDGNKVKRPGTTSSSD